MNKRYDVTGFLNQFLPLHHGFQTGIGIQPHRGSARSDRAARVGAAGRLPAQYAARRYRFGQDVYDGQRDRRAE